MLYTKMAVAYRQEAAWEKVTQPAILLQPNNNWNNAQAYCREIVITSSTPQLPL